MGKGERPASDLRKPVILVFAPYFLPGYRAGGPIRTIANMVDQMGDEFSFRVVTLDRDLGAGSSYPGIAYGAWTDVGGTPVRYVKPGVRGIMEIVRLLRTLECDAVYLNSVFNLLFAQVALFSRKLRLMPRRPFVLAPRGAFNAGALALKERKKQSFLRLSKVVGLFEGVVWHASSEFEEASIRAVIGPGPPVVIARNLPAVAGSEPAPDLSTDKGGPLLVCTLSRISPMKNLDYALSALAAVSKPVIFTVYGPVEDEAYWRKCQSLAERLPDNVRLVFAGPIAHECVVRALSGHDLFLLPTRGENYGHVIYEALAAGLPLLISDRTPWRGLEEKGVGWDIPLSDESRFVRCLEEAASWSTEERIDRAQRCRELARMSIDDGDVIAANRSLFRQAIVNRADGRSPRAVGRERE